MFHKPNPKLTQDYLFINDDLSVQKIDASDLTELKEREQKFDSYCIDRLSKTKNILLLQVCFFFVLH